MPVCGIKRRRMSVDDDSEEETVDLEQQQRCLLDISVTKLQQEQSSPGAEPKLLKSVLISNAVRLLQCHMSASSEFDIDILTTEEESEEGTPPNFLYNTFGPNGYLSVVPSPCPEGAHYSRDDCEEVPSNPSGLSNFTSALLDRLEGIMEVEVDSSIETCSEVATQVEVPYELPTVSNCYTTAGVCTTGTTESDSVPNIVGENATEHTKESSKDDAICRNTECSFDLTPHSNGISCTEPLSEDSGLGESMDVPLSLVVQDFHSVDLSLYDYDSQDPLHPSIDCLGDTQGKLVPSESHNVPSTVESPAGVSEVSQTPSVTGSGNSRYGPHRESPLVTECRRSEYNSLTPNFIDFGSIGGLFVES